MTTRDKFGKAVLTFVLALVTIWVTPTIGQSQGKKAGQGSGIINGSLTPIAMAGNMNAIPGTTVLGWKVSHGSPTVTEQAPPGGGSHAVQLWSFNGKGEGIFTDFQFKKGQDYLLSITVQNDNTDSSGVLRVVATNGLQGVIPPTEGMGDPISPSPIGQEIIDASHKYSGEARHLSFTYTPSADFSQLWVYPYSDTLVNQQQYSLLIDMIHVLKRPSITSNGPVACGEVMELKVSDVTPGVTYTWFDVRDIQVGTGHSVKIADAKPSNENLFTVVAETGDITFSSSHVLEVKGDCGNCAFRPGFQRNGCNTIEFFENSTGQGVPMAWDWDFGDGHRSKEQHPVHQYSSFGQTTVALTVSWVSPEGQVCKGSVVRNIEVCDPDPCSFSPKFETALCNPVTFTDASNGSGMATGWHWDFGDGKSSKKQHPEHKYKNPGQYGVTLTVEWKNFAGQTCERKFKKVVLACDPDPVDFKPAFRWNDCRSPLAFQDMTIGNEGLACTYSWDFGDGYSSTEKEPEHNFPHIGTFEVCQTISWTDGQGIKGIKSACNDVKVCNMSVMDDRLPTMSWTNGPATRELAISTSHMPPTTVVTLWDQQGTHLTEAKRTGMANYLLGLSDLPSGTYLVTAASADVVISRRLVMD